TVAKDVVFLRDHVAKVDPDAELYPVLRRTSPIALRHPTLRLDRASHGINHTGELGQKAVAGVLHDPAAVFVNLRFDQLSEMRPQPRVRPLLIRPHQARIARHIGCKDGGKTAYGGHARRPKVKSVENTPKPAVTLALVAGGLLTDQATTPAARTT